MFRALWIKEWSQLRALRWVGFGLGALLPPFLLAAAAATRNGGGVLSRISTFSTEELLLLVAPPVLSGLWGLLALLLASQAFIGDRAQGTEQFLLQRPVPRRRIWQARLLAAVASLAWLMAAHAIVWGGLTEIVVSPTVPDWTVGMQELGTLGLLAAVAGLVGGIAAAGFVHTPIHGLLLGLVLAALPAGLGALLAGMFPMAELQPGRPLGLFLPWMLLAAYPVASFLAHCRGEPAGRGRIKRAAVTLTVAIAVVPVVFFALAPTVIRWRASRWIDGLVGSNGSSALALSDTARSGWIVDLKTGERVRFLPPPLHRAVWSDDGSTLAVLHESAAMGGLADGLRLDLLHAEGDASSTSLALDSEIKTIGRLHWYGDRLIGESYDGPGMMSLVVIDSRTGDTRRVALDGKPWWWQVLGGGADGEVYLRLLEQERPPVVKLLRLDLDRGTIDPEPVLREDRVLLAHIGNSLSPSGRYYARLLRDAEHGEGISLAIRELSSGIEHLLPSAVRWAWLEDDRLVSLRSSAASSGTVELVLGGLKEEAQVLRSWQEGVPYIVSSPDRRRLLVQVVNPEDAIPDRWLGGTPLPATREDHLPQAVWIHDSRSGSWTDIGPRLSPEDLHGRIIVWAGSETLALYGSGGLGLLDLETDGRPRFVFGG